MRNLSRRQFLRAAALGAGGTLLQPWRGLGSDRRPTDRPNIIVLLTDDQRADALGCMGNAVIRTPNIDRLAREGVLFTNAFVTTSICASSRASIFTGQWMRRHGIKDFRTHFTPQALAQTYPMLLRQAGYRIGFVGKYGVGVKQDLPIDKYDYWRGFAGQGRYEHKDENGNYKHLTRILGEQAIEFIRTCPKDQPFCLSVSFKAPHCQDGDPRQFIYDPAYESLYQDVTITPPETAAPKYFQALPKFLQQSEARRRWQLRFATPEMFQRSVKSYYRLITGVDVMVGQIRDELRRLHLENNTVIIYTSDNGFYLGEHGLAGKWFAHEESIRVPMILWDGRAGSQRSARLRRQMVLNVDLAPTILDLARVPIPESMQGRSLLPLVRDDRSPWRSEFFYEHLFRHPTIKIPPSEAVRTQRFKYIRYIDYDYEQLYDLQNDPHETRNLAYERPYRQTLQQLRRRCDELARRAAGTE